MVFSADLPRLYSKRVYKTAAADVVFEKKYSPSNVLVVGKYISRNFVAAFRFYELNINRRERKYFRLVKNS